MNDQENHRDMTIQYLDQDPASDKQIIDMLLLLLDDWEVRAAVMRCMDKRRDGAQYSIKSTQG